MKRIITLLLITLGVTIASCKSDTIGPDPFARKHAIKTVVTSCLKPAATYNLQVSWVNWNWQAIFLRAGQPVATVTDSSIVHQSGCVYALGDKARVTLIPLGAITQYLDSAIVDVDITPTQ